MNKLGLADKKGTAPGASNERPPPTAALKRFAIRLQETPVGQRYLQINKDRVAEFLNKSDVKSVDEQIPKKASSPPKDPYSPTKYSAGLNLQQHPEFRSELGTRSRFGDGDGSFFDLWLNSGGEYRSKQRFDADGLPVVSKTTKSLPQPLIGFKRQYMLRSGNPMVNEETKYTSIEPYEVRRQRRLEREAKEKEELEILEKKKEEELLALNSRLPVEPIISNPYVPSPQPMSSPPPSRNTQRSNSKLTATAVAIIGGSTAPTQSWKVTGSPPRGNSPPSKPTSRSGTRMQALSTIEKNTYFGEEARTAFFDYYKQLSRQQYMFVGGGNDELTEEKGSQGNNGSGLMVLLDERIDSKPFGGGGGLGASKKDITNAESRLVGPKRKEALEAIIDSKYGQYLEEDLNPEPPRTSFSDDEAEEESGRTSPAPFATESPVEGFATTSARATARKSAKFDETPVITPTSESRLDAKRRFSRQLSGSGSPLKALMKVVQQSAREKEKKKEEKSDDLVFDQFLADITNNIMLNEVTLPVYSNHDTNSIDNALLAVATRPVSARSKFLISCVSSQLKPDPSMVIRKHLTSSLNISSKSIGNKMARVLASGLSTMPLLEELKLADNKLTDEGLTALIDVLSQCPRLTSLDISQNKVDDKAAQSLNHFLSDPKCKLTQLLIRKADVDDLESAKIVQALSNNRSIKYIDMSSNLLGSHELRTERLTDPNFITGPVALSRYLTQPECSLKTLILSWNMIRLQSCNALVQSIATNTSLTHLDLSYNSLGQEGGEALGDSLHTQRSLQILNIAHNNIHSRAAFIIMAGVRSCETLTHVDLSENPIGEVGGKAVMSATMYLGNTMTIEIKGCALRAKDPSCWFDTKKPPKDVKLNLTNRYDRAVCMEMLRLVASNDDLKLVKCKYYADRNSGGQDLEFVTKSIKLSSDSLTTPSSTLATDHKLELERAQRLFRQYDEDGNGSLDRHELSTLLTGLGLVGSREAVDQMLAVYDLEGAGVIEEKEFVHFLQSMQASAVKASQQSNQRSFLVLKGSENMPAAHITSKPNSSSDSRRGTMLPTEPTRYMTNQYIPPNQGTIEISVKQESAASAFLQTATSGNVQSVLNATKAIADSSAMIDCALDSLSLKFEQAMILYRIMIKEMGDRNKVLLQLLPRMETPADARRLFNKTSNGELQDKVNFRSLAGKMYDAFMRVPSGYFDFNLNDEHDRTILHRFVEIHKQNVIERHKLDCGDTSENGDWMINFRNVLLDGKPYVLTNEWLEHIPTQGHICFDFVPLFRPNPYDQSMSDIRLCNMLVGLGLLAEDQRLHIFARLAMLDEIGRTASKGVGISSNELTKAEAEETMKILSQLKSRITERPATVDRVAKEREAECAAVFARLAAPPPPVSGHGGSKSGAVLGKVDHTPEPVPLANVPVHTNHHGGVEGVPIEAYAEHLRHLNTNRDVSFDLMAANTVDALVEVIAGRYITVAQLSVIIECFPPYPQAGEEDVPRGAKTLRQRITKYNSVKSKIKSEKAIVSNAAQEYDTFSFFSTFKVELIITLFPQIIDLVNFEMIFSKLLTGHERALIYLRLGILNVWNPLKMDGGYYLNLEVSEQRQILKILILMAIIEPGENWMEEAFYENHDAPFTVGWELPTTWFIDTCIPRRGIVAVRYFSGNGTGMNHCAPNPMARMLLMSLVHAQPYAADAHKFQRASIHAVHELNVEFGSNINFERVPDHATT